jgi:nitronate monooxygenase
MHMRVPIIQAPMAGVSSPAMAAAVSNQGGLGSLGVGAMTATVARQAIREFRDLSKGPLNVNVFVHRPARRDKQKEHAWLARLRPQFERVCATVPAELREVYVSFLQDDDMLSVLIEERPTAVSFHFGLPGRPHLQALKAAGIALLATATNEQEALAAQSAGLSAVVAQGYEAGGHRGIFDPDADDSRLPTTELTRVLVKALKVPVIAAGGIMEGAGIAAALRLGAHAAQLGTAFVGTSESLADTAYCARLFSPAGARTVMTRVISGRPARCLENDFTAWGAAVCPQDVPDYPIAYDLGKALHKAATAAGESGYGAQWAGRGAPLAREMTSTQLMRTLETELTREQERRE